MLMRLLSQNEATEDAIWGGHPDIDVKQNDIAIILIIPFVLWNQLLEKFQIYYATLLLYSNIC